MSISSMSSRDLHACEEQNAPQALADQRPDNAAGLSPPLRRAIAAALMGAMAAAAVVAGAMLGSREELRCSLSVHEALPDLQAYRAGCPEARP